MKEGTVNRMPENRRVKMTKSMMKEALLELLEKKPLDKITVKDVCENADVNRSTFYSYYESIEQLLLEIEDDVLNQLPMYPDSPEGEVTGGDVLQHIQLLALLRGLQLPGVGIGELAGLVIAQRTQDHDHQLIAGHLVAGRELVGGSTDNDLGVLAVVDVTPCPVVAVEVGKLGLRHVGVVGHILVLDVAGGDAVNKHRGLSAVQFAGGPEGSVFLIALEYFELVQNGDGSRVGIAVIHIREARGAGGCHERKAHNEGQHQRENLLQISHGGFFLLFIF